MGKYIIIFPLLISCLYTKSQYSSTNQIKEDWSKYTGSQRKEALSFCQFLFKEKHYERSITACLQYLYNYPNDPISNKIVYNIARSYDEIGNHLIARKYYARIINSTNKTNVLHQASSNRRIYSNYLEGNHRDVLSQTEGADNPYALTMRAYSLFSLLEWGQCRAALIKAEEAFNNTYYSKKMIPLYQSIKNVAEVPQKNKYKVAFTGAVLPGGGYFSLDEWEKGQGPFLTSLIFYGIYILGNIGEISGSTRLSISPSSSVPHTDIKNESGEFPRASISKSISTKSSALEYRIPSLVIGAGVYFISLYSSFKETQSRNKEILRRYVENIATKVPLSGFLDFPEPDLLIKGEQ